ncbi:hypothetical protein BLX88_02660, partial [Bacillus obstructivus]
FLKKFPPSFRQPPHHLSLKLPLPQAPLPLFQLSFKYKKPPPKFFPQLSKNPKLLPPFCRSEERRVGEKGRFRVVPPPLKKKNYHLIRALPKRQRLLLH